MGEVTHEQVNLMLRLYEMRREPLMREARELVRANFPPGVFRGDVEGGADGSKENAYVAW